MNKFLKWLRTKWLKKLFSRYRPVKGEWDEYWKYKEGVDFKLIPDLEATKAGDPRWNILFLDREIKLKHASLYEKRDADGKNRIHFDLKAEVLYDGEPLNEFEKEQLAELAFELVARRYIESD